MKLITHRIHKITGSRVKELQGNEDFTQIAVIYEDGQTVHLRAESIEDAPSIIIDYFNTMTRESDEA